MKKRIAIIFFTEQGGRLADRMREVFRNRGQFPDAVREKQFDSSGCAEAEKKQSNRSDRMVQAEEWPESAEVILYRKMNLPDGMNPDVIPVSESLHDWCAAVFSAVDALIFIGASGIAVRTIAPFLVSKTEDPAVLVADEAGKYVISLLSGHLGGGNALTRFLAERLGADPVITTASDVGGKLAIDVWAKKNHLHITDFTAAKAVAARIVRGEIVPFYCEGPVCGEIPPELKRVDAVPTQNLTCESVSRESIQADGEQARAVIVSVRDIGMNMQAGDRTHADQSGRFEAEDSEGIGTAAKECRNLHLVPRAVILGIGCKKGKSPEEIGDFVFALLRDQKIAAQSICKIASIDLKAEEEGLIALSKKFGVPFETFSAETLNELPGEFTASGFVAGVTGVDNVCERAAMAAVGGEERDGARFLCRKISGNGVTAALLEQPWDVSFE